MDQFGGAHLSRSNTKQRYMKTLALKSSPSFSLQKRLRDTCNLEVFNTSRWSVSLRRFTDLAHFDVKDTSRAKRAVSVVNFPVAMSKK